MARYTIEGFALLYHTPTLANPAAPTVAELNAGTDLTCLTPRDGFAPSLTQNTIDTSALCDSFDTTEVGSEGGSFTLTFFRDNVDDTAWDLYVPGGVTGFLVWREGTSSGTAWAAGQDVQVWPYSAHKPMPVATASNTARTFTVTIAITAPPHRDAIVAA